MRERSLVPLSEEKRVGAGLAWLVDPSCLCDNILVQIDDDDAAANQ
jgi:hypothetical protein